MAEALGLPSTKLSTPTILLLVSEDQRIGHSQCHAISY